MFTRTATGIALSGDGSVDIVELNANLGGALSARFYSGQSTGGDVSSSWQSILSRADEDGFSLANAVVGVPADITYQKSIFLPFRGRRKISQVLLPELEGELPVSAESAVADFVVSDSGREGTHAIAVACEREKLEKILDVLPSGAQVTSLQTDLVGLSAAALFGGHKNGVAVYSRGGLILLSVIRAGRPSLFRRFRPTGESMADVDLAAAAIAEVAEEDDGILLACGSLNEPIIAALARSGIRNISTPQEWDLFLDNGSSVVEDAGRFLPAVGLALKGVGRREAVTFDLRQGPLMPSGHTSELRVPAVRTAALVSLVLFLALANLFAGYNSARGRYDKYSQSLRTEFEDLFPGTKVVSELAQLEGKISKLEQRTQALAVYSDGATSTLTVLGELSRIVPADLILKVNEFYLDTKRLRLEGTLPSFDAVEKLKNAVETSPLFSKVSVQNARVGADSSRVSFRLQMEVHQGV